MSKVAQEMMMGMRRMRRRRRVAVRQGGMVAVARLPRIAVGRLVPRSHIDEERGVERCRFHA